ncbi:hypothetical protein HD554DRAFT_505902 [Boletus coccyginus]|nr:hypothetical protein HD554DRAFT_505902 [Boletus coccyginus]
MAPTPPPRVIVRSPKPASGTSRHLHHLRRQDLIFSHDPPRQPSSPRTEQSRARTLDVALQPSVVTESPLPPPIVLATPSDSVVLAPEPSAIPVGSNQPQGPNPPADISGNIVAAVVVVVLILGGLVGLVIGGEMLRRQARSTKAPPLPSRCFGRRKPKATKNATGPPHRKRTKIGREKFPYDEKTLTPLVRPLPALNRERQRGISDVWPIRSLSRALCNHRSCPEQVERCPRHLPLVASPQTTWSEFSSVSLYVAPPRTVLACIPEELEDCQSQANSDMAAILGATLQRPLESRSVVSAAQANQPKLSHNMLLDGFNGPELSAMTEIKYESGTRDEDAKSLGSSAPDMTSDEGESSRSSMASLESLEGGNDRESLGEEVFELRRAQTRSMQMNKGVLLSLSLKTLDDSKNSESTHGECGPSRSSAPDAECGKDYVERELSLAMLGGTFSAVDLDEFPSPPSILPMIPSFVSGF